MITQISLSDFKSFKNLDIHLKKLNLLVGTNSSGKSSVLQSILLASQTLLQDLESPLNGPIISVGEFFETRNYVTNAREIFFKLHCSNKAYEFSIFEDPDGVCKLKATRSDAEVLEILNIKNFKLSYVSANRIGVMNLYPKKFSNEKSVGHLGEFSIDTYERNKNKPLRSNLIKDEQSNTLEFQLNFWLKYILGTEIRTEEIKDADSVKAMFSNYNSRFVRPKNIGSGTSFMLSILVSCLIAEENSVIILENPEIHLHPKAQARLIDFLVFISNSGPQLIIETHSDHIFNGVRRSIVSNSIASQNVSVNFLCFNFEKGISDHTLVKIGEDGRILEHVEGLFDQFNNDLDSILGIK